MILIILSTIEPIFSFSFMSKSACVPVKNYKTPYLQIYTDTHTMAAQLQQSQAAATTGVHEIEAEDTFQVKQRELSRY